MLLFRQLTEENYVGKKTKMTPQETSQSLCSGVGDKAERWAGAHGEEQALERGGRASEGFSCRLWHLVHGRASPGNTTTHVPCLDPCLCRGLQRRWEKLDFLASTECRGNQHWAEVPNLNSGDFPLWSCPSLCTLECCPVPGKAGKSKALKESKLNYPSF